MHRILTLLTLVLILCSGSIAGAAVRTPQQTLDVAVSQGVTVSLPRPAGTIFIAEPEIASYQVVSPDKLLVFGRLPGRTSLFALDGNGGTCYSATISVAYDTRQMMEALRRDFPSLSLKLTPAADGVVVSGEVPSAQVAADVVALLDSFVQIGKPQMVAASGAAGSKGSQDSDSGDDEQSGPGTGKGTLAARHGKIINRLTVTMPTQVTIRVRVAEVNRNLSEKLGFKWGASGASSWSGTSIAFGLADNVITGMPGSVIEGSPDIAGLIDALAEESLVSVLAEPNLSVVSGETASFLAGGQTPFPTYSGDGDISVEFKDFGVLLSVTPTILSPNRISLRLRPEVSEPNDANGITLEGIRMPGFVVRRAETTVELASGQSFAIGGLLQNSLVNSVSKIPGLGDIPVLGALARSTEFQRGETELVIIATAYVSGPAGGQLRIPNAQLYVPSVFERMLVGKTPEVQSGPIQPADFVY